MDGILEGVSTLEELRAIVGEPHERIREKSRDRLDESARRFIRHSPFVLVASVNAAGDMDVSPKGDPPGFVKVLDERTLAIPDRPGNRRADTLVNVLERPSVGLLFIVPGRGETLRCNGRAAVARPRGLPDMSVGGRAPQLVLLVTVREVFMHCPKCALRSGIWDPAHWPTEEELIGVRAIPVRTPLY